MLTLRPIPSVTQLFQFQLIYLQNKKEYWWYIQIVISFSGRPLKIFENPCSEINRQTTRLDEICLKAQLVLGNYKRAISSY
jgi:hypothetical protein